MAQERFEDLPVWQAAADLYGFAEGLLREPELGAGPGWRDQFERAALAISSHVARASERNTAPERLAAAGQARASLAEVRSMLRVLERRKLSREVQVPVSRLKALAESCARQLLEWSESCHDLPVSTPVQLTARAPTQNAQPRLDGSEMRRRTVEVARKILGILPNHQR